MSLAIHNKYLIILSLCGSTLKMEMLLLIVPTFYVEMQP